MKPKPGCAELETELDKGGLDSLESNFRCVVRLEAKLGAAARSSLVRVEERLSRNPACPRLLALKGKLLWNLDSEAEARAALERSLDLDPGQVRARAWLGGLELLAGRVPEAAAQLDLALAPGPSGWALFWRAAARLSLGQGAQARRDLELLLARAEAGEERPAAEALRGLALSSEGLHAEAAAALGRALESLPGAAWLHALRAKVHRAAGDAAACLRDLDAAVQAGASPWILLERSRFHEEQGDIDRALEDADAALALEGPRASHYMRRAHLQVCRRHYHLAVPEYTAALELEPALMDAWLGRAMVHCIRGEMEPALADARRADELSGGDAAVTLERLRVEAYAGLTAEVRRGAEGLIKARPDLAPQARLVQGMAAIKAMDWRRADADLEKGLSPGKAGEADLRLRFYQAVARGLDGTKPAQRRKGPPRLLICGLGIRPPYTATLETLRAIRSCDLIFNNLSEPEIAGLLALLSPEWKPTMFDIRGADSRWTKTIFRDVRPGRTVGFVTRGHPLVCGGLACSLIEECGRVGAEYKVYGSVSSMNTLASDALPEAVSGFAGQQVLDYSAIFSPALRLETRIPAVIYFNATVLEMPRETYLGFCRILEGFYGPKHKTFFYGRSFNAAPETIALEELREFHGRIDPSYTLLIPPR